MDITITLSDLPQELRTSSGMEEVSLGSTIKGDPHMFFSNASMRRLIVCGLADVLSGLVAAMNCDEEEQQDG